MDTLENIKAFLATARLGGFSRAARQLGVAPSVVTKRVSRLEDQLKARLLERSTRRVALTEAGERFVPRAQLLVGEIEDMMRGAGSAGGVEGHLRVKAPTTVTIRHLGGLLGAFQAAHPGISLEVVLADRSVNPIEEGYDLAIGALPASYGNVVDVPLCPYPRVLCASPGYLAAHGRPQHPRDLVQHDCLTFHATGSTWSFESPQGAVVIDVRSRFSANETSVLHELACGGRGIAMVAEYIARDAIRDGRLERLLPGFPVEELWLKALVPRTKWSRPPVQALVAWLRGGLQPRPPWDLERSDA